ncbi:MAG TPA: phage baseplate protein [Leptolyngbyaceae cyanobacterium]
MNSPTALELLQVWEQGFSASPMRRALYLLAVAHPNQPWENLVQLSIGCRDRLLLNLREQLFGSHLASVTRCPQCQEPLELSFTMADVRVTAAEEDPVSSLLPPSSLAAELSLQIEDYTIQFRLPNSLDLERAAGCTDPEALQQQLLESCVLSAQHQGADCAAAALPEAVVSAIAARMAAADPQADVQIALSCPACEHQWHSTFDIVQFFWSELHVWAQRTLVEVHRLARAYGWHEADILAMSPQRRQLYLEMVQQ